MGRTIGAERHNKMNKYRVAMAQTETTVYYYDVEAEHEGIAEEIATDRFINELSWDVSYNHKKIVSAKSYVYEVKELKNED
jgi:hypothetical protein